MTTLTINDTCKTHVPNKKAISVIATNFYDADEYSFCEMCEQNITRFSFYDDDRGMVYSSWKVGK